MQQLFVQTFLLFICADIPSVHLCRYSFCQW